MSERMRKTAGLILMSASLAAAVITAACAPEAEPARYRSGNRQEAGIPLIEAAQTGTIDVNSADAEELTALPGIGETLAGLIVAEREEHGPFLYAEDLTAVKGIGPKTLEKFREMILTEQTESGE